MDRAAKALIFDQKGLDESILLDITFYLDCT